MNKHNMVTGVAALLWLLASGTAAAVTWGKPGLWEETETFNGKKGETKFECYTLAEVTIGDMGKEEADFKRQLSPGCKLKTFKMDSAAGLVEITCPEGSSSIKTRFESPTSRRTLISATGKPIAFTQETVGRWVSTDCGDYAEEESD